MPNWCCQNVLLRGRKERIKEFCNIVNSALTRPDAIPDQDFGKLWLGNVYEAFGNKFDQSVDGLRGCIDPDGDACAYLCGPEYEERELEIVDIDENTASVAFSVIHAWAPSRWFNRLIAKRYGDLDFAWKATDEFGNFHDCHNRKLLGLAKIEIYDSEQGLEQEFDEGEEQQAATLLSKITGKKFSADEIIQADDDVRDGENETFWKKIVAFNNTREKKNQGILEITIWNED